MEEYLYEPHAALIKAGGLKSLCTRYRVKKLHPNSHLYTSHELVKDFPGRIFNVEHTYKFNKKDLKNLQELKQAIHFLYHLAAFGKNTDSLQKDPYFLKIF